MKLSNIIIDLGLSISKSILKIWLGDSEIAKDISLSITEILGQKIKDIKPRRPASRFFERIADEISEAIEPLLEIEYKKLSECDKEAALKAAIDTFESIVYGDDVLFKKNLDPILLYKYVTTNSSETYELSDPSKILYDVIVNEACNAIIEVSSTLPNFNLRSTQELLKREALLLNKLQEIIEKIPSHLSEVNAKSPKFEIQYRRRVARVLDTIQIYGVSSAPVFTRYRLSTAYISLSVSINSKYQTNSEIEDVDEWENNISSGKVEEILPNHKYILIRGEAGSGKTTLLQWLAVNCARKTLPLSFADWDEKIPLFVKLREHDDAKWPEPQQFGGSIMGVIADEMPKGWVHDLLRSGKAIVLLDGIDEVSLENRSSLIDWMEDLIHEYPLAYFLITSRPSAIDLNWLSHLEFVCFDLDPMSRVDQSSFIEYWHEAIIDSHGEEKDIKAIRRACENLIHSLSEGSQIRNLSTNPLLCAITCAINLERNARLPAVRSELYRIALESLVDRRDAERFEKSSCVLDISYLLKEYFLKNFSFWLMQSGKLDASISEFEGRIKSICSLMPSVEYSSKEVSKFLIERSGVLRTPTTGRIDFIHKTFQEYLTAKHIASEDLTSLLIDKSRDDNWHQVIILFTSQSSTSQSNELLGGLLDLKCEKNNDYDKITILAAVAANEATTLSPEIFKRINIRLSSIIPPKNFEDARKVALAGELALPYLRENKKNKEKMTKAACIRALSLIGTESSFSVLKNFSSPPLYKIEIDELIKAWKNFDQYDFARDVLFNTCFKGPLVWQDIPDLTGFEYLTELKDVDFSGNQYLQDIRSLEKCSKLRKIDFSEAFSISNLQPIANLSKLTYLSLSCCSKIKDFSFLENLFSLEVLILDGCVLLESLKHLSKLKKIKLLSLNGCYEIENIRQITSMNNLIELNLGGCYAIKNFSPIEKCLNLEILTVAGAFALDTIADEYLFESDLLIEYS